MDEIYWTHNVPKIPDKELWENRQIQKEDLVRFVRRGVRSMFARHGCSPDELRSVEGLLLNSRMVQGIFDDLNPETRPLWAYPDTGKWDAERNTREFLAAMPEWRRHGLLAFTINLQGGSPQGYSQNQPWHNSAIEADGALRADYLGRLERILNRADELGMVVILGYFYFGQDQRLTNEAAVLRAADNATDWLLDKGWRNVLVEINNECNVRYDHELLKPGRVHELIQRHGLLNGGLLQSSHLLGRDQLQGHG